MLTKSKAYRRENKELINAKQRGPEIARRRGHLGPGLCEICELEQVSLHRDHCHWTGLFRGKICKRHNLMLGNASNHPAILRKAADYLEKFYNSLEGDSRRLVDAKLDEVLAIGRTTEEFPVIFGIGNDGSMHGQKSLDGHGCSSNVSTLKLTSNSTVGRGKEHGTTGHGDQVLNRTTSGWRSQADGFDGQDDTSSGASRFDGESALDNSGVGIVEPVLEGKIHGRSDLIFYRFAGSRSGEDTD